MSEKTWHPLLISSFLLLLFIVIFSVVLFIGGLEYNTVIRKNEVVQQESLRQMESEINKLEIRPAAEDVEINEEDIPPDFLSFVQKKGQTKVSSAELPRLFVSYNSADYDEIRKLTAELSKSKKIGIWLDEQQLRPGEPVLPHIEDAICEYRSVAVLIGRSGLGPWQKEEVAMAMYLSKSDEGRSIIPVLLPDAGSDGAIPGFLRNRKIIDMREESVQEAADQLIWGVTGRKEEGK
jgi:hypothetical protein